MLFSKTLQESIHQQFLDTKETLGLCSSQISSKLQECNLDERTIIELFYSTMPVSDIGDYDFSLYRKFADFGIFLAENSQWHKLIPEDIFLNYVVYYRINNEAIEDCRKFFYNALIERVKGKNMKEAALEVNKWCAEHVTYQSTDERTASPLTLLKSSYGRCGEESTMAVTALRSVGIPARQVYTPRWAHCDDNHAWVEVWCDGEWYFLGACEPEPVLNRGWFNEASARAMLVDTKAFLPIKEEEAIEKNSQTIILNELSRYAPSKHFTVTVTGIELKSGVTVHFELLNSSEFSPIASIDTDETGKAGITLGLGSIHIHAVKDHRFVEAFADTKESASITLDFSNAVQQEPESQEDFNFYAPVDNSRNIIQLTEEQKNIRRRELGFAEQKRKEYQNGFYQKDKAEKLASQFSNPQKVIEVLKASEGNFDEIYDFLSLNFGIENRDLQLKMLTSLLIKDYTDVRMSTLAEHFKSALKYKNNYPTDLFVKYILCPRAHYEQLSSYREILSSLFDQKTVETFHKQPKLIWEYVSHFKAAPGGRNERLAGTPAGIICSGQAGSTGRKVLFTAICRTLGIPGRINPVDLAAQYYQDGEFINAEELPSENPGAAVLTLLDGGNNEKWAYMHNWTIAFLNNGVYQTLELTDYNWINGKLELSLSPGSYRLITSSRMPNGNQFAKKYCFRLANGDTKSLKISLRQTEIKDMLENIPFSPFNVFNEKNESISINSIIGDKTAVLVWLEEGREPTEHILNEFIEAQDVLNSLNCKIIFIIRDHTAFSNHTFAKACNSLSGVSVYCSDFSETAVTMARRMYVDPESLPLTVVAHGNYGIYAYSGYNVGIAGLLIKVINMLDQEHND